MDTKYRMPAEWERTGAVMLAWPHESTDWNYMLPQVRKCYVALCEAIGRHSHILIVTPDIADVLPYMMEADIDPARLHWFVAPTNDTWTRDYGPISTTAGPDDWAITDFAFNGWGLKFAANCDNLVTRAMCVENVLVGAYRNELGFVLEGGSIEADGRGTILTTSRCLLSPNRNGDLDRIGIEKKLRETLGAEHVLWLDHGALEGDDTDSHIDTLARLAPDNTILYVAPPDDVADSHYAELDAMRRELEVLRNCDGEPFRLLPLPLPDPIYDEDGQRLPATYANYLVLNDAVLVPVYGQPETDKVAVDTIKQAFPEKSIETVDCTALICQHGSLHCATMQLPYEILAICPTPY